MVEKTKIIKKEFFLAAGLLSLLLATIYFFIFETYDPKSINSHYIKNIETNINKEIGIAQLDLHKVDVELEQKNYSSFYNLKTTTQYPIYVFKNEALKYWSDYRYVPDYKDIKSISSLAALKYNQQFGVFLKQKRVIGQDTITLISVINLYRFYKNENDYLQSGYNNQIFNPDPTKIALGQFEKSKSVSINNNVPLFYLQAPEKEKISNAYIPHTTLLLFAISAFLISIYFFLHSLIFIKRHQFGKATGLLLAIALGLRILMIITGIPFVFFKENIFAPVFYTSTFWAPTFGDTLLNTLFALIFLAITASYYYRSRLFLNLLKSQKNIKSLVSVLMVMLAMVLTFVCSHKIEEVYTHSLYNLDFSLSLGFSLYKTLTLVYYLLILGIFFIGTHLSINIFLRIHKSKKIGFFHWLYGFLAGLIVFSFLDGPSYKYVIVGVYFMIVYFFRLSRFFYTLGFQTILYFILNSFCFALVSIEVICEQELGRNRIEKQTFGNRYLAENDLLGEGLLDRFKEEIKNEPTIAQAFLRDNLAEETINQIIKDQYLDIYFDKYDVQISTFNHADQNLDQDETTYPFLETIKNKYQKDAYKTEVPNLYFVNETGNSFIKEYILFCDILSNSQKVGTIVVDLKLKDSKAESVFPELLLDKKFVQNPESKNYSYCIFEKNQKMIFNSGSYNYQRYFPTKNLKNEILYSQGLALANYSHLAIKGKNGRTIVVSQEMDFIKNAFSNFSFLFLLSILGIIITLVISAIFFGLHKIVLNFSTKIQLYLNAAFLLPLVIIIILTLSVVRSNLISIQEKTFVDNTKNIASTLQVHLDNYATGKTSRSFFETEINDLARSTKLDINFYDVTGKLNFSTRPLVYQYHLLSKYVNPKAYSKVLLENENEILVDESLGSLSYKTVYLAMKNSANSKYGVVSIPFFDAKTTLDLQVKEVVTTILIIFLALFLVLLILSFFASNQLTSPLKLIAQRLKKTNLDKLDEEIEWKPNDEIGLLTKSYNNMIKKLEESKVALSQSEKQTAWREMAKQVAHEIKNPLTPMKLSIQQLQRTLPTDDPKSRDRIQRALNSLTEQIDNISEIANSFSEFAKMPVPRNEKFDLIAVAQKTTDLYSQNNNIKIIFETKFSEILVIGDRLLLSRVITNLILNGIQSVPPVRQPEIKVRVYKNPEGNFGMLEVSDNGTGIAEEVRKKVFIPNFSTKVGGSGLGLAMAKRGIEHAGGNIWFETYEGLGTTFFVDLPIFES
jgi:two-component system, NtrC family, nitrogen regulation sensor histidine kinase NtrY